MKRYTVTLDEKLIQQLKQLSEQTMIPQSKLVNVAIRDLIEKYQKKGTN
jgi:metal-responsive CopG/Arc/MetJ family transcriptional regulator